MRLGVLGALEVHLANAPVAIGSLRQRRLLSVLAAHAGEVVSGDRLAEIVWLGSAPTSAGATLQTLVWRLRVLLGADAVVTTPPGYALGAAWVDAHEFERLLRGKTIDEALSLWRGRPFAEFADEEWARPSVVRLEELHAMAREMQVDELLESGRTDEAVAAAEALSAAEPFRERAHGVLMQALAQQGRAAEALRVFERFRRFLAEESGLEPSAALTEIARTVLAQDANDAPSGAKFYTGNLPAQQSSFVGRGQEIAELAVLLSKARIITLTGVGGVGKTRLALQVAAEVSPRFRHGAWMVDLAPIRDQTVVINAIAAVFAISPGPGVDVAAKLAGFLRHRELLLLLDNCEHLLDPLAVLVRSLERVCPKLVVMATSRESLGIAGERIVGVQPMPLSASDDRDGVLRSDAALLFVERAVAVKSDFAVTDANAAAIAEVVRRLDGIPLALELAASRVAVLSPTQLAQRLTQRFRVLGRGERGAIERHATLRAAIDWSYEMLDTNQQRLLARLSVFAGGCSLEAVEAVCSTNGIEEVDVLDLLAALVARSLVVVDDGPGEARRYRLLETIRQYAEERLDAAQRVEACDRHGAFYANFVETAARGLQGPDQFYWLVQVEPELENLRTAMAWTVANDRAVLAERFLWAAAETERGALASTLLRDADAVLEMPSIRNIPRYAFAVMAVAYAAQLHGRYDRADHLCEQALRYSQESNGDLEAWAAAVRAQVAVATGDFHQAIEQQERAVTNFRRCGNPYHVVRVLNILVAFRTINGDFVTAANNASEALAIARRTGNPGLTSSALAGVAYVVADAEPQQCRDLIAESLQLTDELGSIAVDEQALVQNLVTSARLGERDQVLRRSAPALERGFTSTARLGVCLEAIAVVLAPEAPTVAATLHGQADTLFPNIARGMPMNVVLRQRSIAAIETQLGAERTNKLRARGAGISEYEGVAYALDSIARVLNEQ